MDRYSAAKINTSKMAQEITTTMANPIKMRKNSWREVMLPIIEMKDFIGKATRGPLLDLKLEDCYGLGVGTVEKTCET